MIKIESDITEESYIEKVHQYADEVIKFIKDFTKDYKGDIDIKSFVKELKKKIDCNITYGNSIYVIYNRYTIIVIDYQKLNRELKINRILR